MDRLVLFADRRVGFAPPLAAAALRASRLSSDVRAVALVDATGPGAPPRLLEALRRTGGAALRRLSGGRTREVSTPSLARLAREERIPLIVPPGRDVNHPDLARRLTGELGATLALSVGCLPIFRPHLLSSFSVAVNYHDGALPAYRGLGATAWSVYRGEPESGFTFHHMVEALDAGSILLHGAVPIPRRATGTLVGRLKAAAAAAVMPEVLARMAARDPGTPQAAGGEYFSQRRRRAIMAIDDPAAIDWTDLQARLRAFGRVALTLDGRRWDVTRVDRIADGARRDLAFVTRDGVAAAPVRFLGLPRWLYLAALPFAHPRT